MPAYLYACICVLPACMFAYILACIMFAYSNLCADPSERTLDGLLKGHAGGPPEAKAKGVAAKAKAKAATAGKAKAQARGLGGGRVIPEGALLPAGPPPVTTRRWMHCGWDTDFYDKEAALAVPGGSIGDDASGAPEDACCSRSSVLPAGCTCKSPKGRKGAPSPCAS